jgi:hypothetical protein
MALQTKTISYGDFYYGSVTRGYVLDLILTEESVDQVANTSVVSFKFQLRSGSSNRFTANIDCFVTIAGQEFSRLDKQITAAYNTTYTLLTGTLTVPHGSDGSLNMEATASIDTPASNPYAPPDLSFTGYMDLTPIPRASTLAATAAFIEDASTIVVSRKSAAYTYTLRYAFGELGGYLADAVGSLAAEPVELTDATILFPLPVSFYEQIPDAPSGVCTLTCTTYSGDIQIGEPQKAQFLVTADPARSAPAISGWAQDINEKTLAVTGDSSVFVQGVSTALCGFEPQARNGASITAVYVNGARVDGLEYEIPKIETAAVTYRAVDSRGYSSEYSVPGLSLVPYVPLSFHASVSRTDPTSGNATLAVQGKWYNGSFGAGTNALTARYNVDGGAWATFSLSVSGGDLTASVPLSGLDYRTSHRIEIAISDAIQHIAKTVSVSKGVPVFDWGESDFAFHVPVRFTATDGTEFTLDLVNGQLTAIT